MAEKIPVIYKMGPTENLSNVPIKKGQILVTNDKGKMYIDVADEQRLPIGGTENVVGQKTAEGGEIFNTEYGNIAGGKCFKILETQNLKNLANIEIFTKSVKYPGYFNVPSNVNTYNSDLLIATLQPGTYYIDIKILYSAKNGVSGLPYTASFNFSSYQSTQVSHTFWIEDRKTNTVNSPILPCLPKLGVYTCTEETELYFGCCTETGPNHNSNYRMAISIIEGTEPNYNYILDSIEGIEVNDIYSLKIGANYDFYGSISAIVPEVNGIIVNNYTEGTTTDLSDAVMWFPYKPQIGTQVNGGAQSARGYTTTALNWGSSSEGFYTLAEGKYSHAQNYSTIAGYAAHAEGQNTKALGEWSHAQGMATSALNRYTFSFGNSTVSMENYFDKKVLTTLKNEEIEAAWKNANPKFTCANGYASTAGGNNTLALGAVSTALGKETIAKGDNSLSTGYLTSAEGENSASFGKNTHAIGGNSITFGDNNTAYGKNSTTFGSNNNITEWKEFTPSEGETYSYDDSPKNCINALQVEGSNNTILKSQSNPLNGKTIIKNSHIEGENNKFNVRLESEMLGSHIEGLNNTVDGMKLNGSHIEGFHNNISYKDASGSGNFEASHVEGYNNKIKTSTIQSHVEGTENTIESDNLGQQVCVHVEGYNNKISNSNYSHTQGTTNTVTNSPSSHVGGWKNTITKGDSAFAHGHGLKATGTCSFVIGKYNVESNASAPTLSKAARFIVGNGTTESDRSNAFTVYADGHGEIQTQGTTDISLVQKQYVDTLLTKIEKLEAAIVALGGTIA